MNDRSYVFPKGEYYFGDLSYVIDNPEWEDLFCFNGEGDWDYKDKEYLWFYTRENGWFLNHRSTDDNDMSFPSDRASVGLIPTDLLDPKLLEDAKGIIFNSNEHEIKIVVQGDEHCIYGIHVFLNKPEYCFKDKAILVVFNEELIDEDYFYKRCPNFSQKDLDNDETLFIEDEEEIDKKEKINKANSLYEEAKQEYKVGDYKLVLEKLNKAIEYYPYDGWFYYERGQAKDELEDYLGAEEDFTVANDFALNLEDEVLLGNTLHARGHVRIETGNKEGAYNDFSKAADMGRENALDALRDFFHE